MNIRWGTLPDIHQMTNLLLPFDDIICLVEPSPVTTDLHVQSTPILPISF